MSNNIQVISLSTKKFTLDGADNKWFTRREIPLTDLKNVLTTSNYSTIEWDGNRLGDNFKTADAIMIDLDHDATIDDAVGKLDELNLSYILITSKSHTPAEHRFHILLPTNRPIRNAEEYKALVQTFCITNFPNFDKNVVDGARFLYGSPIDANFQTEWSRDAVKVDDYLAKALRTLNIKALDTSFPPTLKVRLADGTEVLAAEINVKTPIYCPYHRDSNPSAFISYSPDQFKHYIHCSSCDKTWWEKTSDDILEKKCGNFWSHKTKVYEAGLVGDVFSMQDVGKEKFFIRSRTKDREQQANLFDYLVTERHIHAIESVENHGSAEFKESSFEISRKLGKITVKVAARAAEVANNALVETFFTGAFSQHKDFIKKWLAMFSYTNYVKLPSLILTGERGSGKSTAAELMASIFPTLSLTVQDLSNQFNPFAEKKLLIIDETTREGRLRYEQLKQLSGSEFMEVNKKNQPQFQARLNLNLIILSNNPTPIFVRRSEMPTSEANNQFFVYKFPELTAQLDSGLKDKLRNAIGHYVRTELKTVYDAIKADQDKYRYAIPVPITDEERALFVNNVTEIESAADGVIDDVVSRTQDKNDPEEKEYYLFFGHGQVPHAYLEAIAKEHQLRVTSLVQELREKGYLKIVDPTRHTYGGRKYTCYSMTTKFLFRIKMDTVDTRVDT